MVTPRQLSRRAGMYHQLAALTSAGVGLIAALEMIRDAPPSAAFRKPLRRILESLGQGATFSDALTRAGRSWLPVFDSALLHAGEISGRLDLCFRLLAQHYEERARLARQIISELAYPAFVMGMAILIFPIQLLSRLVWNGDWVGYLMAKAAVLLPLSLAIWAFTYLTQGQRNRWCRAALEKVLALVPVLGTARRSLALARLSSALESLVMAGVSVVEAWPLAAAASGSVALERSVSAWKPQVSAGQTPAEAVREAGWFPDLFTNLYATGEISGQLDDTLRHLYRYYQEDATRKLHAVAQWTPRLVYFVIMLLVAYQIVSFWTGYFSQIDELSR